MLTILDPTQLVKSNKTEAQGEKTVVMLTTFCTEQQDTSVLGLTLQRDTIVSSWKKLTPISSNSKLLTGF